MRWFDLVLVCIVFGIFTACLKQYFKLPIEANFLMCVVVGVGVAWYDSYLRDKKKKETDSNE